MTNYSAVFCVESEEDILQCKCLMRSVFGDAMDFVEMFFNRFFHYNIYGIKAENEIVSMAFILPSCIKINGRVNGRINSVSYVYACATNPNHRGMGLMRRILDTIFDLCAEKGDAAIFLLPANEPLYGFYEKMGFEDFFYWQKNVFQKQNLSTSISEGIVIKKINVSEYQSYRNDYLKNIHFVDYPLSHFQFIETINVIKESGLYGVFYRHHIQGCIYIEKNQDQLFLKEFLVEEELKDCVLSYLLDYYHVDRLEYIKPNPQSKSALIRWAPGFEWMRDKKGYFNFALD